MPLAPSHLTRLNAGIACAFRVRACAGITALSSGKRATAPQSRALRAQPATVHAIALHFHRYAVIMLKKEQSSAMGQQIHVRGRMRERHARTANALFRRKLAVIMLKKEPNSAMALAIHALERMLAKHAQIANAYSPCAETE